MHDIRYLAKPRYKNSWALIIGIDSYKNASPLSYAVSDAKEIGEILANDLGFERDKITCLIDKDATKEEILRSFMRFTLDDVELDDRIFVFFAGHGHTRSGIRGDVGFLVAADTDPNDLSTYIRWDALTGNSELIRAKHMFFVMDACYGGLALTRTLAPGSTRFLRDMMRRYARQVLTAGKANEVVADSGGPLPNHSIFTGHLIEGMRGSAATADGVITANGLMAYVYEKVANDKKSNQTPHHGFFDGDGDFILRAAHLAAPTEGNKKYIDELIVVPFVEKETAPISTVDKISLVKALLDSDSSGIKLHDFLVHEVEGFLSATSEDHFPVKESFSPEQFQQRLSQYEDSVLDLSALLACVAYWAKPEHDYLLNKILAKSTDRLHSEKGGSWQNLPWHPIVIAFYCCGIASIEGQRYDSLAQIFYSRLPSSNDWENELRLIEAVGKRISGLAEILRLIPEHQDQRVPVSEYLYEILQPKLDDVLFIGKSYERVFDEFEVLFSLAKIDLWKQNPSWPSNPLGRFAWKHCNFDNAPYVRLIREAKGAGEKWPPLKAGLFGGDVQRFNTAVEHLDTMLSKLNWG